MRVTQVRPVEETLAEAAKLEEIYELMRINLIPPYSGPCDVPLVMVDNRELVRIELSMVRGELNPEAFFLERSDDQYRHHVAVQARAWREGKTDFAPSEGWAHLVPN